MQHFYLLLDNPDGASGCRLMFAPYPKLQMKKPFWPYCIFHKIAYGFSLYYISRENRKCWLEKFLAKRNIYPEW